MVHNVDIGKYRSHVGSIWKTGIGPSLILEFWLGSRYHEIMQISYYTWRWFFFFLHLTHKVFSICHCWPVSLLNDGSTNFRDKERGMRHFDGIWVLLTRHFRKAPCKLLRKTFNLQTIRFFIYFIDWGTQVCFVICRRSVAWLHGPILNSALDYWHPDWTAPLNL